MKNLFLICLVALVAFACNNSDDNPTPSTPVTPITFKDTILVKSASSPQGNIIFDYDSNANWRLFRFGIPNLINYNHQFFGNDSIHLTALSGGTTVLTYGFKLENGLMKRLWLRQRNTVVSKQEFSHNEAKQLLSFTTETNSNGTMIYTLTKRFYDASGKNAMLDSTFSKPRVDTSYAYTSQTAYERRALRDTGKLAAWLGWNIPIHQYMGVQFTKPTVRQITRDADGAILQEINFNFQEDAQGYITSFTTDNPQIPGQVFTYITKKVRTK